MTDTKQQYGQYGELEQWCAAAFKDGSQTDEQGYCKTHGDSFEEPCDACEVLRSFLESAGPATSARTRQGRCARNACEDHDSYCKWCVACSPRAQAVDGVEATDAKVHSHLSFSSLMDESSDLPLLDPTADLAKSPCQVTEVDEDFTTTAWQSPRLTTEGSEIFDLPPRDAEDDRPILGRSMLDSPQRAQEPGLGQEAVQWGIWAGTCPYTCPTCEATGI